MIRTLPEALPAAEFVEVHSRVIDAPPERVWAALLDLRWTDLRWTVPLAAARGLGLRAGSLRDRPPLLERGPVRLMLREEGRYLAGGRVARPWRPVPELGPDLAGLDQLAGYTEPGWLKYGMDFRLHPLPGGRTRLETATLCQPTDDSARRRFARYWAFIRPFSGLIRRDMLNGVARRCRRSGR